MNLVNSTSSTVDTNGFDTSLGQISGTGTLSKDGAGNLSLGASSDIGTLNVNQGTVSGVAAITVGDLNLATGTSVNGSGSIKVTGALLGTGTIGIDATVMGTLNVGSSPGTATVSSDSFVVDEMGTFVFEAEGNTLSTPGTDFDQINFIGGDFELADNSIFRILFSGEDFSDALWDTDRSFVVVENNGSGTVTLGNVTVENGFVSGRGFFDLDTSGGNLNLAWTAVPEPSSLILFLALSPMAVFRRRR